MNNVIKIAFGEQDTVLKFDQVALFAKKVYHNLVLWIFIDKLAPCGR